MTAILPESIDSVGQNCFGNCKNLETVHLPGTLRILSYCMFDGCANLKNVFINRGKLQVISNFAFIDCTSLNSFAIPSTVTVIGMNIFRGCSGLSEIALGNQLVRIGNGAFWDCNLLETVTMNKKTKYTIEDRPDDSYNSFMPNVQINKLDIVDLPDKNIKTPSTNFQVRNFMMVTNDISARVNEVKDSNNEPCALIKLQVNDDLLSIEGNLVIIDNQESPEKWVYVTEGTKLTKLVFKKHLPITLSVTDYGLEELKGKSTYVLRIE